MFKIGDRVIAIYSNLPVYSAGDAGTIVETYTDANNGFKVYFEVGRTAWLRPSSISKLRLEASTEEVGPSPVDPKQSQGSKKVGFGHIPITALLALSPGTKNGADKYGAYNWLELQDGSMSLNTYLDAVQRHLLLFRAGQDSATDSGIHHLDHILAGVSVVRDAMLFNKVADDRIKLSEDQIKTLEKLINQE